MWQEIIFLIIWYEMPVEESRERVGDFVSDSAWEMGDCRCSIISFISYPTHYKL